jgi:hypothetical protein
MIVPAIEKMIVSAPGLLFASNKAFPNDPEGAPANVFETVYVFANPYQAMKRARKVKPYGLIKYEPNCNFLSVIFFMVG